MKSARRTSTTRLKVMIGAASAALIATMALGATASSAVVDDPTICEVTRTGNVSMLAWKNDGGIHVVYRNGSYLSTPGSNASIYTDNASPAGATYQVRTWIKGQRTDRTCIPTSPTGCVISRAGSTAHLAWVDNGGTHVLLRNGTWIATPGNGTSTYTDTNSTADSTYVVRTWLKGQPSDRACASTDVDPGKEVARVIHISIDGLRADHATPQLMPNLTRLRYRGASTLNARSDPDNTQTLPNHHSQFTGRPMYGPSGHRVDYNEDMGSTVHAEAGTYVASVFDVVHDHGGHTLLFAGKPKFDMMDREWSQFGAPDTVGADNGTDKIDYYQRLDPALAVDVLFQQMNADPDLQYMFFHIRTPDEIGHLFGWATADYRNAATTADTILGRILDGIDANPAWASSTAVIVVADHGGPTLEFFHSDHTIREDYTIPFVVYGPGVAWGTDLYQLNPDDRAWPFTNRPPATGVQPIREHEVANLALDFLGYPSVPGSVFNVAQDLNVS